MSTAVTFVRQLPDDAVGAYCEYNGTEPAPSGWRRIDIRAICHRHQARWSNAFVSWHGRLTAEASRRSKWAWLLDGSRIHVWQEPMRPMLFALGLATYLESNPEQAVVVRGCPPEVATYLREFRGDRVAVRYLGGALSPKRSTWRLLARVMMEVITIVRLWRPRRRSAPPLSHRMWMFSTGLTGEAIRDRGDHYFARALDRADPPPFWLYHLAEYRRGSEVADALRETGRAHAFDHDFLTAGDSVWVLLTCIGLRRQMKALSRRAPLFECEGKTSAAFPADFVWSTMFGGSPIRALALYRSLRRLLRLATPSAICYPYEEKGLERAIIFAASEHRPAVRTVGFAHNAYNSGLMFVNQPPENGAVPPRPDAIAAGGLGLPAWFAGYCHRPDTVVSVGSPRWLPSGVRARARKPGAPLELLFVTAFGYELDELASWVEKCPDILVGCRLTVRPNPTAWQHEQAGATERLKAIPSVQVAGGSLSAQIETADLVLFCSTSAASEAMWVGRRAVYVELNDLWVANPFTGKPGAEVIPHCLTPDDLRTELRRTASMTASDYEESVTAQRHAAAQIYAPFDIARFTALMAGAQP